MRIVVNVFNKMKNYCLANINNKYYVVQIPKMLIVHIKKKLNYNVDILKRFNAQIKQIQIKFNVLKIAINNYSVGTFVKKNVLSLAH